MVFPLKTWHHPQPKGLWPTVTGLAVATHIGVLGLSLPYMLNLMRSGDSQATNFVPVELIEVEPTAVPEGSLGEGDASEGRPKQDASATTNRRAAAEPTVQPVETTSNNVLNAPSEADVSAVSEAEEESAEGESAEPEPEAVPGQTSQPNLEDETASETDAGLDENSTDSGVTDSDSGSESRQAGELAEADPGKSDVESNRTDNTPPDSDSSETTELPMISGEQDLPLPSEEERAVSSAQSVYIRVVGHSYVPEALRRDIADTLPEPISYPGIQLDTEAVSCGRVDFPVGQVAYRMVIDSTGTLKQVLPWTGSIESTQMSEEESAIACLIESAGFSFIPAASQDTPVANSDLILTLDIVESNGN